MPARTRSMLGVAVLSLVALLSALASHPSAAQTLGRVERERGLTMLRMVREDLEKNYYDPTFRGMDVARRFAEAEARVQTATTSSEMLGAIADVLLVLDDSHTFFVPPGLTIRVDYGWEMQFYRDSCLVSEVRPNSDAEKKGLKPGDLVLSVNGIRPARENLWKIFYLFNLLRPQRSLRLVVQAPGASPRQLDLEARVREHYKILDLTTGEDIWRLVREVESADAGRSRQPYAKPSRDLLIWKLRGFSAAAVWDGVKQLKDRSALILDLRGNGGGSMVSLLDLLGRFFAEDVAVGTQAERSRTEPLLAKGRGMGAYQGQVIVLVDSRSASAAEIFARAMQLKGRARVIGDRTSGAVMRARAFGHTSGTQTVVWYATSVTDADVLMADGGRLEKTGMLPDVVMVPASADLAARRDPVLAHAAQLLGVTVTPEKAWQLLHED